MTFRKRLDVRCESEETDIFRRGSELDGEGEGWWVGSCLPPFIRQGTRLGQSCGGRGVVPGPAARCRWTVQSGVPRLECQAARRLRVKEFFPHFLRSVFLLSLSLYLCSPIDSLSLCGLSIALFFFIFFLSSHITLFTPVFPLLYFSIILPLSTPPSFLSLFFSLSFPSTFSLFLSHFVSLCSAVLRPPPSQISFIDKGSQPDTSRTF